MLSAACLRNLALDAGNKTAVVETGALPPLVACLRYVY